MIVFHWIIICNVFSPIVLLLYIQVGVNIERLHVEHIWPEVMGIMLAVNACMVPFMKIFVVEKVSGLSTFAVSIDSPHAIGELVKEYFKILTPDRRGCSTETGDEDDK